MTQAGATKCCAGIVSTELFGRSRPEIQWIGASKCVPVCSPQEKLFQYQAGPRSSYLEISSRRKGHDFPNSGGSWMTAVPASKGWLRSITRISPPASAWANCLRIFSDISILPIKNRPILAQCEIVRDVVEQLCPPAAVAECSDSIERNSSDHSASLRRPGDPSVHDTLRGCGLPRRRS